MQESKIMFSICDFTFVSSVNEAMSRSDEANTIAAELSACTTRSNQSSHKLCQYALENVLLHQAAAQQLQVGQCDVLHPDLGSDCNRFISS